MTTMFMLMPLRYDDMILCRGSRDDGSLAAVADGARSACDVDAPSECVTGRKKGAPQV